MHSEFCSNMFKIPASRSQMSHVDKLCRLLNQKVVSKKNLFGLSHPFKLITSNMVIGTMLHGCVFTQVDIISASLSSLLSYPTEE